MAFQEFFDRKAEKVAFQQKMEKFGQIRDKFLEMLVKDGVESTHGFGEVIFGDAKGRKVTTVKLVAAGDWEGKGIPVEISVGASKNKLQQLQQANRKPTVYVKLTFDDRVVRTSIPNNVTNAHTDTKDNFGNEDIRDETFSYKTSAEVMEYFQTAAKMEYFRLAS